MYAGAVDCNGLHFSLCELDEMYDFAREVGWACTRLIERPEILDPDALSVDHIKMETIRHAHMVLERARTLWTSNSWQQKTGTRDADFVNATSALGDTILPLRDAIRVWQSDEGDPSDVSAAMDAAFSAMCALPNGPRLGVRDTHTIVNQMNALRVRQDSAPITTPRVRIGRIFI